MLDKILIKIGKFKKIMNILQNLAVVDYVQSWFVGFL